MIEHNRLSDEHNASEQLDDEEAAFAGEEDTADEDGLFPGDRGHLPLPARRLLVQLLRSSYISSDANAKDWPYLFEHRSSIESALNDLFLELHVDKRNDIAYCLPVEVPGESFPKLKHEHELTETQSLLIVFLRQQYASQISSGAENVWVDGDDIHEYLGRLFSEGVVNHALSAKTIDSSIDYLKRQRYIEPLRGAQERYRVLPIIETAFPLEKIQKVLEAYKQDAEKRGQAAGSVQGQAQTQVDVKTGEGE